MQRGLAFIDLISRRLWTRVLIVSTALVFLFAFTAAVHSQQPAGPQQPKNPAPAAQAPAPAPGTSAPSAQASAAPASASTSATAAATPGAARAAGAIATEIKLVTLYATVRDKKGKIVSNLEQSAFTIDEDGRPQAIKYFARDTDIPIVLGLLADTSLSQRHVIGAERTASAAFFGHMLRADKDKAFLIHFDREVELLEDVTNSHEKLNVALNDLRVVSRDEEGDYGGGRGGGGGGGGRDSGGRRGGTHLYDAVYLAANEVMKSQKGRKAIVIFSDGDDRGSKVTLSDAVEAAQRADAVVYSVLFVDPDAPRSSGYGSNGSPGGWGGGGRRGQGRYPQEQRPDGKKILERISRETGGRLFQITRKEAVDDIYAELEEELRKQYSFAYTPDRPNPAAGYHMLKVAINQKDLTVQSRDGYYSDK